MLFTSVISTLAVAASAAAFVGPAGDGSFKLQVITTDGKHDLSGQFLAPYHTGAGLNALVPIKSKNDAVAWNFTVETGHLNATLGPYPYSMVLDATAESRPPKGYQYVGLDVGGSKNAFHFKLPGNFLQFGPSHAKDNFAICPARIYTEAYVNTLVYRAPHGHKNHTCTDIKLKAIF